MSPDVVPVDQDGSLVGIEEAEEEAEHRGFATPARAHQSTAGASRNVNINTLERRAVGTVAEMHVAKREGQTVGSGGGNQVDGVSGVCGTKATRGQRRWHAFLKLSMAYCSVKC